MECRRLGLPGKLKMRLVSLRWPSGELEVLATSLLDEVAYGQSCLGFPADDSN